MTNGQRLYLPTARTVTIANGATVSGALDVQNATVVGLITPAALTGVAFTFQVSMDNSTYVALNDSGTGSAISATVAASKAYAFDPIVFLPWGYVKVVSGSAEGAARTITLVVRPVA